MAKEELFEKISRLYSQKSTGYSPKMDITVDEVYTPESLAGFDYARELGNPGEYPFTRGNFRDGYRGKLWTMRPITGYGTPKDTIERVKYLAELGISGFEILNDLTTIMGVDADHPIAGGFPGRQGIPMSSLEDMETFLKDVPMDKISVVFPIITAVAPIIMAQYIATAEKRGIALSKLMGTISNDPLRSPYSGYPPGCRSIEVALRLSTDFIEYSLEHLPRWNCININLAAHQAWGISTGFGLAIAFSRAIAHIEECLKRGLDIEKVGTRFSWYLNSDLDFFEMIAELRAARRMWAKIMRERFGAKTPRACMFRFATGTSGYTLFPQEPVNNIIRLTLQILASILGGTQSMQPCSYDEPIAIPTEESARISLRMQQIIAHETGIANVVDPLGGSYYLEWLTNKVEEQTNEELKQIEKVGGIKGAMESKWLNGRLEEASYKFNEEIISGKQIKVGVNAFTLPGKQECKVPVFRVPSESSKALVESLHRLKETRENGKVRETLGKLYKAAHIKDGENLMPYILEAVKAYATTGEIYGTIHQAYGFSYDSLGMIESPFDFATMA
jgi:methylmalonyl-CoA mutase N-terminal domain/subunit